MILTGTQIAGLLKERECERVEFKRGGNGAQKDTFETICAFLNRFGGDVFLGVTDDGEIVDVPHGEVEPIMRHIVNVASDPQQMDPPFYLSPDAFKVGRLDIVHVWVPPSADVHRFKGVVYDRLHEADVRIRSTEAIAQMFIRKHEIYTERRVYPGIKEIGRADELGSGTRNLYHYTRLYSGADPIIDEEDAFSFTVPLNDDYSPEVGEGIRGNDITQASIGDDTVNDTVNGTVSGPLSGLKSGLNETDSKLIGCIQSNPNVTIQELQEMLKLSRNGVRKVLGRLKATGWLRRIGPDKGGHWEVLER